jgi:hypothetical protein
MWKRVVLGVGAAVLVAGGGAVAWKRLHPPPPPPKPEERTFEQIPKDEYEKWMQDLGYTE